MIDIESEMFEEYLKEVKCEFDNAIKHCDIVEAKRCADILFVNAVRLERANSDLRAKKD